MTEKTPPRAKSLRTKITEGSVLLLLLMIGTAILFPMGGSRAKQNHRRMQCQSNLKYIMLAVKQYAQDYDERFPLLVNSRPEFGWAGSVEPYMKGASVFQCPSEENSPASPNAPSQMDYTDYWFNARTAGKHEFELTDTERTITLGDGDSGDAQSHLLSIPARWRTDENSPLYRHLDGANYAFADGHVKWFKASNWKNELDFNSSGEPTLRLKPMK